jgi:hypothetical protein
MNFDPSTRHLWDYNEFSLIFSFQLRHEALRGAYSLIATPETPYGVLCKVFRYCIFTSTRDEIKMHLDNLINRSTEVTQSWNSATSAGSLWDGTSSLGNPSATPETFPTETGETYFDPEGINDYLYNKGLVMDSASSYAEFSVKFNTSGDSRITIFDEMCQKERVKVNVHKLFRGEEYAGFYKLLRQ